MTARTDPFIDEAIHWSVRLQSGHAAQADRHAFEDWLAGDTRRQQAWDRLQRSMGALHTLRSVDGRTPGQALQAQGLLLRLPRRRRAMVQLAALCTVAGAGLLAQRQRPLDLLAADIGTGTGERRTVTLADGSTLWLGARSAVDVAFVPGGMRRLRLRGGEIVVQVAADAARPFVVATAQAEVRALGTRFLVRQEPQRTLATVLQHSVEVRGSGGRAGAALRLAEGEGAAVGPQGVAERLAAQDVAQPDWMRGLLVIDRRPLAYAVAELQRYRGGVLRLAPDAADMVVYGVFPLDDVDRALQALAETLPLRVTHYGPWLTTIARR